MLPSTFLGTDLLPFNARTVGFDQLFDTLDSLRTAGVPKYPPYNITKLGEDNYQVVVAVAGLSKDMITVEHDQQELIISHTGIKDVDQPADMVYIHKGLAARDFSLKFKLATDVEVVDAVQENGLLTVNLKHVNTKEKPKLIPIL